MAKSAKIAVTSLEQSPSHLLHRALQLALDLYAVETGPGAVTQRQYAVLAAVAEHEGLTQTDLVRATGIDRSTLADMIAWAKATPGKLSIGTTSIGGFPHMSFELLATMAGFNFVNVAYKGNGPIISDLLGGRIEGGFSSYTGFAPLIQAGKLRLLGITNPGADPLLPDLPVMGDTVKGYGSLGWFGLVAPKGTPPAIVDQLNREINAAMALEDVRQTMQKLGMTPAMITPQAFGEIMTNDYNKFGKLVRDIGFERQ